MWKKSDSKNRRVGLSTKLPPGCARVLPLDERITSSSRRSPSTSLPGARHGAAGCYRFVAARVKQSVAPSARPLGARRAKALGRPAPRVRLPLYLSLPSGAAQSQRAMSPPAEPCPHRSPQLGDRCRATNPWIRGRSVLCRCGAGA